MTSVAAPAPRGRRRRARALVVALVVVVVLVAAAWIAIDTAGRSIATDAVRTRVAQSLGVDPAAVAVDLGSGSLVPQLIAQRADDVKVDATGASLGQITGDLRVRAEGVPFAEGAPTQKLTAVVTLTPEQIASLAGRVDALADARIVLGDGGVRIESSFGGGGLALPVSVTATASADDGAILLTPTHAKVGTLDFDIAALRSSPFASLVDTVAGPQRICVASSLPQGLELRSVSVHPDGVDATVSGRDVVLGTLGSAPRATLGSAPRGTC
ncbi:DUF2993 domain-containing protein [Galbitalea sp. SE-J8]|uniref:LmeA family phospholipid-binding protein n=1 Tax=Galbitalea sp. SE-J8 TaxID=3054952 RepID=UPI00259CEFAF|nr:DUF2993 domain-containing protein [Galbitalea sp. SE-J8]MDM4763438.1 DUF2993 domain-containing protein [Galbitalea sp. SE-J8]